MNLKYIEKTQLSDVYIIKFEFMHGDADFYDNTVISTKNVRMMEQFIDLWQWYKSHKYNSQRSLTIEDYTELKDDDSEFSNYVLDNFFPMDRTNYNNYARWVTLDITYIDKNSMSFKVEWE